MHSQWLSETFPSSFFSANLHNMLYSNLLVILYSFPGLLKLLHRIWYPPQVPSFILSIWNLVGPATREVHFWIESEEHRPPSCSVSVNIMQVSLSTVLGEEWFSNVRHGSDSWPVLFAPPVVGLRLFCWLCDPPHKLRTAMLWQASSPSDCCYIHGFHLLGVKSLCEGFHTNVWTKTKVEVEKLRTYDEFSLCSLEQENWP